MDIHSVTPEEVLEQANRIFAPYKLSFGAPLSWFAVWKSKCQPLSFADTQIVVPNILPVSERVARSFSSPDQRVHLVGDAAYVISYR